MGKKSKGAEAKVLSPTEKLRAKLAAAGITKLVTFAEESTNIDVDCVSTGFPQLDYALHPIKRGWPRRRKMEIYSGGPSAGKSTLMAQMMANAQRQSLSVAFGDVEGTTDLQYLKRNGCITTSSDPNYASLLLLEDGEKGLALSAEDWLQKTLSLSDVVDLVVIDGIAALDLKADSEKDMDDPSRVGGTSKLMGDFYKRSAAKQATVMFTNQSRDKVGGYSPSGGTPKTQPGGWAPKFYSSIRIELTVVDKIWAGKAGEGDPIGFKTKAYLIKNKIAFPYKQATLSFIDGIGFSSYWDYLEIAMKMGVIIKKGSWLMFENTSVQGMLNFHNKLIEDAVLYNRIKMIVNGEEAVQATRVEDGREPTKEELEEMEREEAEAAEAAA